MTKEKKYDIIEMSEFLAVRSFIMSRLRRRQSDHHLTIWGYTLFGLISNVFGILFVFSISCLPITLIVYQSAKIFEQEEMVGTLEKTGKINLSTILVTGSATFIFALIDALIDFFLNILASENTSDSKKE